MFSYCVSLVLVIATFVTYVQSALFSSDDYDNNVYLDEDEMVQFCFTVLNDTHVQIGVICNNPGWCAIGISSNGQMPDSDIMFFWIDDNDDNNVYLQDRYAETRSVPLLDTYNDDLTLIDGSQEDDITYIEFIRQIYTCDDDDISFSIGTSRVLYAFNENDPTSVNFDSTDDVVWHGSSDMGYKSVNVLSYTSVEVEFEESTVYHDIRVPNYTIQSDSDTTYYCTLLKLPQYDDTQHIISIDPLIREGNEGIVHHMVVYHCPASYVNESHIGLSMVCDDFAEMPIASADCHQGAPVYAWAIGGESFVLPSNVGIEMSGDLNDDTTVQYVVLEVHYDNPNLEVNITDNSGFRFYYTPDLRNESASGFWTGIAVSSYTHFVPSGMVNATNTAFCSAECMTAALPSTGVQILSTMLHAHTAAIAIKASIIRNNTEVVIVDNNPNYDFNYQTTSYLNEPITLYPSDEIFVECVYDTSDRSVTTYAGESTSEEMCMVWFTVFPKISLKTCWSTFVFGYYAEDEESGDVNYEESSFYDWVVTAYLAGYVDASSYEWIGSSEAAIEWYEKLWTKEKYLENRGQLCEDDTLNSLVNSTFNLSYFVYDAPIIEQYYQYPDYCGDSGSDLDEVSGGYMMMNSVYGLMSVLVGLGYMLVLYL